MVDKKLVLQQLIRWHYFWIRSFLFFFGIVVDNEASQSSGIRNSQSGDLLLHFQCGAHTLEFMDDALTHHYNGLENSIELAWNVASTVLEIQQVANSNKLPLQLLLPSNTRKRRYAWPCYWCILGFYLNFSTTISGSNSSNKIAVML